VKRIGITQRVVNVPGRLERRDVLDQRWYDFADEVGILLIPIPNKMKKPRDFVSELRIEGLIFSGGNNIGYKAGNSISGLSLEEFDYAAERDFTEASLLEWALITDIPLIGVCRGMQFINGYLGGSLVPVKKVEHVATQHLVEFQKEDLKQMYSNQTDFNSFHEWGVDKNTLADSLNSTGTTGFYIESFVHKEKEIHGIMWHPERYNQFKPGDIKLFNKVFKF
jgi:N5-(cytidine 5'-diphosphoramidyl)-L-glutamine hydrolase